MNEVAKRCRIDIPRDALAAFCEKHHIRKLALFGSVLRADFRADSDVDVLVEFDPEHVPGFFGLFEMEKELSCFFGGRTIDLVTEKFLNRRIREDVLSRAEVQYVEG